MSQRTRIIALVLNLTANAAALYGAAGYLADGTRLPILVAGVAVTALCLAALIQPS